MTSPNEDDVPIDPLAPNPAPEIRAMFGEKAYQYTLDRMRDLEIWGTVAPPGTYKRQMAYYQFIKKLLEDLEQQALEKQAQQANWRKRK